MSLDHEDRISVHCTSQGRFLRAQRIGSIDREVAHRIAIGAELEADITLAAREVVTGQLAELGAEHDIRSVWLNAD